MTDEITFEDLVHVFNSNHLYPVWMEVEDGKQTGLEIRCPSIQSQSRLALVKSLIPDGMVCQFFSNEEIITIKDK